MKYFFWFISLIFSFSFCFSQNQNDTLSYREKVRSGEFQFPFYLSENDDIELPIEFQIELNITEIRDLDIKKTNFYTVFDQYYTTIRDSLEVTVLGDSVRFSPIEYLTLIYPEGDKTYAGNAYFEDRFKHPQETDSITKWGRYTEVELPHKWNLRDYPFDTQTLKIVFESSKDTSLVRLSESKHFPPKIYQERFSYLMDGFNIKNMTTSKEYIESAVLEDHVEGKRSSVYEKLIFNINVDRKGSYLYFKLFFGGFLSFLISFLVYSIDSKFFETRITLSLGGIFGAVGNKYFVENSMPSIQVLTKADFINNLVILFIILNIFIVIAQHTKKISLWKFENNKFSALFILTLFVILNFLIIKA
jgi:hypothetical protein